MIGADELVIASHQEAPLGVPLYATGLSPDGRAVLGWSPDRADARPVPFRAAERAAVRGGFPAGRAGGVFVFDRAPA